MFTLSSNNNYMTVVILFSIIIIVKLSALSVFYFNTLSKPNGLLKVLDNSLVKYDQNFT